MDKSPDDRGQAQVAYRTQAAPSAGNYQQIDALMLMGKVIVLMPLVLVAELKRLC